MKKIAIYQTLVLGVLFALTPLLRPAVADEPAEQFLESLRERNYFDIALHYLDRLEQGDLVSPEFRKQLPFEKAQTLVAIAKTLKNLKAADDRLDQAQKILTEFGGRDPSLAAQSRTLRYQGDLHYSRAKINSLRSKSDRLTASEKEVFSTESRSMLQQSLACYEKARGHIRTLIDPNSEDGLKIDPQDPSTTVRLKKFQATYTQIRIRLPLVIEQLADTYPANAPERIQHLTKAAEEYNSVYNSYFKYAAGLDARLFAARCNQKLEKHQEALTLLEEIFELGDSGALRKLKRNAFIIACDSWEKVEPYPANQIIAQLDPVVSVINRNEKREPDWLRIQLELALAKHASAAAIKAAGGAKANSESGAVDRQAAKLLRNIARYPSPHRDRARELVSQWNISMTAVAETDSKPPQSFIEARQKAKEIVLDIESLIGQSNATKRKLANANDNDKATFTSELENLKDELTVKSTAALEMLDVALGMADENTQRPDIISVRYLQCFCYFAQQQYFESALIGNFLLDKYPTVDGSRPAMALMIQSYVQMYRRAPETDKQFEHQRLSQTCTEVAKRWPGSPEAGSAATTMLKLALKENDLATAETFFAQIPDDFPSFGASASRLGQKMWFDYRSKLPGTSDQQESLGQQLSQAKNYLEIGARETTLQNLSFESALGCLSLVDAHLASGDVEAAVGRLEHSEIAPLDLIKQKHPAIFGSPMGDLFVRETYKIAIKTYLASMKGSQQTKQWIDKASGVIAAMRDDMKARNDPRDRQRLTQIYGLIATELLTQFEQLKTPKDRTEFSGILGSFLGSIEKDSNDSRTILWSGSTLLNIANSLSNSGQPEEESEAKRVFTQAVSALNRAETLGFAGDPQEAAMNTDLQRQRALAQRGSGNHEAAIKQFTSILEKNSKNLKVQIDAAETFQAWGVSAGRAKLLAQAMLGSHSVAHPTTKRKSNLIWGWQKIMKATRGNDKYANAFYQSLLGMASCRVEYGLLEKRNDLISKSLTEINNAEKRDPSMGGPVWQKKFAALKARIQQNLK